MSALTLRISFVVKQVKFAGNLMLGAFSLHHNGAAFSSLIGGQCVWVLMERWSVVKARAGERNRCSIFSSLKAAVFSLLLHLPAEHTDTPKHTQINDTQKP